jgi:hypothetical protein
MTNRICFPFAACQVYDRRFYRLQSRPEDSRPWRLLPLQFPWAAAGNSINNSAICQDKAAGIALLPLFLSTECDPNRHLGERGKLHRRAASDEDRSTAGALRVSSILAVEVARRQFSIQPSESPKLIRYRRILAVFLANGRRTGSGILSNVVGRRCDTMTLV